MAAATVIPPFANATITNVLGITYTNVWGLCANGTNGINTRPLYRGFASPLATNTFAPMGREGRRGDDHSRGLAPRTADAALRCAMATPPIPPMIFQTGARLYLYFKDGDAPSTLYVWDGGGFPFRAGTFQRPRTPGTLPMPFSGSHRWSGWRPIIWSCGLRRGRMLTRWTAVLMGAGAVESAALFCQETTDRSITVHGNFLPPFADDRERRADQRDSLSRRRRHELLL